MKYKTVLDNIFVVTTMISPFYHLNIAEKFLKFYHMKLSHVLFIKAAKNLFLNKFFYILQKLLKCFIHFEILPFKYAIESSFCGYFILMKLSTDYINRTQLERHMT